MHSQVRFWEVKVGEDFIFWCTRYTKLGEMYYCFADVKDMWHTVYTMHNTSTIVHVAP